MNIFMKTAVGKWLHTTNTTGLVIFL
jgi:hypothetical protein